jgi:signal transduction histidine kinase
MTGPIGPQARQLAEDLNLAVTIRAAGQLGYLYASDACEDLLGRPRAQWPKDADALAAFAHPADSAAVTAAQRFAHGETRPSTADWRLIRPDGAVSHLRTRWTLVTMDTSQFLVSHSHEVPAEPSGWPGANGDRDPLAQLSHDLRSPLNAVLGFAQLLALSELNEQQREELEHIARAGRRLVALIDTFATAAP